MNNLNDHFGKSISLDPEVKQDIKAYLIQNSADYTETRFSVEILDSLNGKVPLDISSIPFIVKIHDDIHPTVLQRESIKSIANCPACHLGVEKNGSFKDRHVEIPDS